MKIEFVCNGDLLIAMDTDCIPRVGESVICLGDFFTVEKVLYDIRCDTFPAYYEGEPDQISHNVKVFAYLKRDGGNAQGVQP